MREQLHGLELSLRNWLSRNGVHCMRVGLGIVFVWLGALKFVPGLSPAEGLIVRTVSWAVDPAWFIPVLAVWEVAIGLGLIVNRFRRATLLLLFMHMGGTFMPIVVCPEVVWTQFPHVLTLEDQYIVKNLVLIGAGLTLCGRLDAEAARDAARPVVANGRVASALEITRVSPTSLFPSTTTTLR